jgi:hypothetical protein
MKSLNLNEQKKYENIKSFFCSKKFILVMVLFFVIITPTFAAETITQLETWSNKVLSLFQSTWVKAILLIALIVEAIGVVVAGRNGGGGEILKKFAPWIIGTIILLSASGICSYFLDGLSFQSN